MAETTTTRLSEGEIEAILADFDRSANREIRAADAMAEALDGAEDQVPPGFYCHHDGKVCPYWTLVPALPYGMNGYCSKLREGDWEGGGGLLFDQVKECRIAVDIFEQDDLDSSGERE